MTYLHRWQGNLEWLEWSNLDQITSESFGRGSELWQNKKEIKIKREGISELWFDKRLKIKREFVEQYMEEYF